MFKDLKTMNWKTNLYGGLTIACAALGFINEAATTFCHTLSEVFIGLGLIEGVDKTRLARIVDAVDSLLGHRPEFLPPVEPKA